MLLMRSIDHSSFSLDNLNAFGEIVFFVYCKLHLPIDLKYQRDLPDSRLGHDTVVYSIEVFKQGPQLQLAFGPQLFHGLFQIIEEVRDILHGEKLLVYIIEGHLCREKLDVVSHH